MKKILFVAPNLATGGGGAERQMVVLARELSYYNYKVDILCYANGDYYSYLLKDSNVSVVWKIENNYLFRLFKVRNYIRNGKYDAVISFLHTANFLNNFSAIGGKSWKIITGERSAKKHTFNSKKGKIFAWFQRYSDTIVCNSNNAREMWEKHYPQYKEKLITIYNIVTLPEITSEYIPRKNGKTHIIVAASYQYIKNPIGLINALALLNNEERNKIKVDWYGKNDSSRKIVYNEANKKINEYHLTDIIELHPVSDKIPELYNKSDVVALFSSVEGLPNAICEAMMIGKPIIMTKVSDYKVLVDESNGFLCDWDNVELIKESIVAVSKIKESSITQMGKNSKNKAKNLFAQNVIINNWLSLIKN